MSGDLSSAAVFEISAHVLYPGVRYNNWVESVGLSD